MLPVKSSLCAGSKLDNPRILSSFVVRQIDNKRATRRVEKVLKFALQFSRPGKSLENGGKVWKNSKKSLLFFQRYNKRFRSDFFYFGQILFNIANTCFV